MNPLTASAQLAAFVWFADRHPNTGGKQGEAMRFAQENWETFLPLAHRGLGRLLLKIANRRPTRDRRTRKDSRTAVPRREDFALPVTERPFCDN